MSGFCQEYMFSFSRKENSPSITNVAPTAELSPSFGAVVKGQPKEFVPSTLVREIRADGVYTLLENPVSGTRRIVTFSKST